MRPSNDLEAIHLILTGLVTKGHKIVAYIDDTWNKDERTACTDPVEAAKAMNAVDEGFVLFNSKDSEGTGDDAWVYFVLGNDPEEVACNYTTNLDPDLTNIVDPWWE